MIKKALAIIALAALSGCTTPHEYVDPIDPNVVTIGQLRTHADVVEQHYQDIIQTNGIVFQAYRSDPTDLGDPDIRGNGGDSCIFTGHKLAIDVYRYNVTGRDEDLAKVAQSLRGLYILTHITGTPGVICRSAFPADRAAEWNYPDSWQHRIENGFVSTGPADVVDPFNPGNFEPMIYYTRATKDQLTGLIFGLSVAWAKLEAQSSTHSADIEDLKLIIARITEDVYNHLRAYDFKIRDEKGENDTNADSVSGLIKTQLLALFRKTVALTAPHRQARITEKYEDSLYAAFNYPGDWFHRFNNYSQYYAWNLRYLRSYSVFVLADSEETKEMVRDWMRVRLWCFTKNHLNAKFIYLYNSVTGENENLDDALFATKSLSLKPLRSKDSALAGDERKPSLLQVVIGDWDRFVLPPHLRKATSFSTWQKEPWDVGHVDVNGREEQTGIDYLMAYWLGRYYNFIN